MWDKEERSLRGFGVLPFSLQQTTAIQNKQEKNPGQDKQKKTCFEMKHDKVDKLMKMQQLKCSQPAVGRYINSLRDSYPNR